MASYLQTREQRGFVLKCHIVEELAQLPETVLLLVRCEDTEGTVHAYPESYAQLTDAERSGTDPIELDVSNIAFQLSGEGNEHGATDPHD